MYPALRRHWPEYLMEGTALGLFMLSALLFTTLLEHPGSPIRQALPNESLRLALIGIAMGLTAVALIYSPWGQRSGAHMNPAMTITFWRLGRIKTWDAVLYCVSQVAGGTAGVLLAQALLGERIAHPAVNYVVTVPGPTGPAIAFIAEFLISAGMMLMVLYTSNTARWARFTGVFAGCLVALYITVEAPLSGMSINPARTTASALPSGVWTNYWLYLAAPLLGMLFAAEIYRSIRIPKACPKLHHGSTQPCIFCGKGVQAGKSVSTSILSTPPKIQEKLSL